MRVCYFVGSSKRDLQGFPASVRRSVGYAIYAAQSGGKAATAKPLKGFGPGVLEVAEDHDGDTYRAVYTVKFKGAVYVVHAFQKKSRRGIATPRHELDLVRSRPGLAAADHAAKEQARWMRSPKAAATFLSISVSIMPRN